MDRAFYSVVQYCPDRFRAEAVNVGLVLLRPEPHAVRVGSIRSYSRVRKLFGVGGVELRELKREVRRLKHRIESANGELQTHEDLAGFVASRANDFRMTEPRLAKVGDVEQDFERLFSELVEERSTRVMACMAPAEVLPPALHEVFYRLQEDQKIWKPGTITVPVFRRKLDIPYAYRNGVVNLVKPYEFSANRRAETQAATLAVNGDLIRKHPVEGEKQQLIVVSTHETPEQEKEVNDHVSPLFSEYGVRLIRPNEAEAYAEEVKASAH